MARTRTVLNGPQHGLNMILKTAKRFLLRTRFEAEHQASAARVVVITAAKGDAATPPSCTRITHTRTDRQTENGPWRGAGVVMALASAAASYSSLFLLCGRAAAGVINLKRQEERKKWG